MSEQAAAEALAALIVQYHDRLVWFLRGMLDDEQRAHDIAQDVFVPAWGLLRKGSAPFSAVLDEDAARRWLYRVAYNRAVSFLRRRRLIAWESLDESAEALDQMGLAPISLEDQVIEAEALRVALASLAPDDAACVLLSVVHGFTTWEIAQIVEVSPEAAKKRLWRAKYRLRAAYLAYSQPAATKEQAR